MAPPSFSTTTMSAVHPDIIETHILTRLDGATLASAACVSSQLHSLTSQETLWTNICHATWPSTNTLSLLQVISSFRNGPRSFFSDSFTNPDLASVTSTSSSLNIELPSELISAVDIYYKNKIILSKVVETQTVSAWFKCSPFRVDLLDPKDTVPTRIPHPDNEDTCRELSEGPDRTAGNEPINLQAGDRSTSLVKQRSTSALFHGTYRRQEGISSEFVQCGIVVTCGRSQCGEMYVREVSLQVEDMDGMHLNGKEILVILHQGFDGKRGTTKGWEEEG